MEQLFTSEYWNSLLHQIINWLITTIPSIVVLLILALVILKLLKYSLRRMAKFTFDRAKSNEDKDEFEIEKRINTLVSILFSIGKIAIWTIIIMIILPKFGLDIKPVLAGAGIIGLAVGFGSQELVRDFISGFFMIFENQVRTGDIAIINGTGGSVEKIELRTITLRDFSGVVHIFQNGKINSLSNMTKEWSGAVLDIGVAYKENTDVVMKVMAEVAEKMMQEEEFGPAILEPLEIVGVDSFADSAVVIRARFKTKPSNQWRIAREYRRRIKFAFDEKGIEIPFPHSTIYWGEKIDPLKIKNENELNQ